MTKTQVEERLNGKRALLRAHYEAGTPDPEYAAELETRIVRLERILKRHHRHSRYSGFRMKVK